MRILIPVLFSLAACGEKAPAQNAGTATPEASASPGGSATASSAPSDAKSQAFASALMSAGIRNFSPSGASGAKFMYNTLEFKADGTFSAAGYVEMDDEKMSCVESGPWGMDPAESKTLATVFWKVESTDCAGRDAGEESRAEIDLADPSNPKFRFR